MVEWLRFSNHTAVAGRGFRSIYIRFCLLLFWKCKFTRLPEPRKRQQERAAATAEWLETFLPSPSRPQEKESKAGNFALPKRPRCIRRYIPTCFYCRLRGVQWKESFPGNYNNLKLMACNNSCGKMKEIKMRLLCLQNNMAGLGGTYRFSIDK